MFLFDKLRTHLDASLLADHERRLQPTYTEDEIPKVLQDIEDVGIRKSMGYLTYPQIRACKRNPDDVMTEAKQRGLTVRVFGPEYAPGTEPSQHLTRVLYCYDSTMLDAYLTKHQHVLQSHLWPTNGDAFVTKVANVDIPSHDPLYEIIAGAFGHTLKPEETPQ